MSEQQPVAWAVFDGPDRMHVAKSYSEAESCAEDIGGQIVPLCRSPRWIPVSERLPGEDEDVLVMTAEGKFAGGGMHVASLDEDGVWYPSHGDGWEFPDVTHWMPLPEPPEVK